MKIISFALGVHELKLKLQACPHKSRQKALLLVNFEVEGDFYRAAQNDDLESTVDYDLLSRELYASVRGLNCTAHHEIHSHLVESIKKFSPLITGGFIQSSLLCHSAFPKVQSML
ncbi:MAG: hypothetical protein KC505_07615 [Myxococcales bacterium]|nr:hypothetical protein [Myxococcales bacterium]USN51564.1 MAG: hypothetical protein H6731_03915 [Myxococcales bacterium]